MTLDKTDRENQRMERTWSFEYRGYEVLYTAPYGYFRITQPGRHLNETANSAEEARQTIDRWETR